MAEEDDFTLVPADEAEITPDEDVAAAVDSALNAQDPELLVDELPEPLGQSWLWDPEKGRFVRDGLAPRVVTGLDALRVWCLVAVYSARYAHEVFTPAFGIDDPDSVVGVAADLTAAANAYGDSLREALLVHDRITAVDNYGWTWDEHGTLRVSFDVLTDENEKLNFGDLSVAPGGTDG